MSPTAKHIPDIRAYEGPDWEPLVEQMASDIRMLRGNDPLRPVTLAIASLGMKIWLTRELARHLGVAANIRVVYPRQLIAELARACGVDTADFNAYSQDSLTWRIHSALGSNSAIAGSPLETYLADDPHGMKRVRLARRLGDLFDRYLAYRPEWIREWDRGRLVLGGDTERWQARIWSVITAPLSMPRNHFPGWSGRLGGEHLASIEPGMLPGALFLVGIAGLPPAYLGVLRAFGNRIPLRVYQPNPSHDFLEDLPQTAEERASQLAEWGNSEWVHHRLLMTCGRTARVLRCHFLDQFENYETLEAPPSQRPATQLQRIQEALRANDGRANPGSPDGSVVIDSCHGTMREVEVLRDRLLDALASIPGLRPRDILVLSPNISEYAAAIHAVFGARQSEDPLYMPYSVADRTSSAGRPAFALASALLALPRSRVTAGAVTAMLESPVSLARLNWSPADQDIVRLLLERARVSWGTSADDRARHVSAASGYGTWGDLLARLRLGLALDTADSRLFHDTAPLGGVDTSNSEVIGQLAERVARLIDWSELSQRRMSIADWCGRFLQELDAWLPDEEAWEDEASRLRQIVGRMSDASSASGHREEVAFGVFAEFFQPELQAEEDGGHFLTEGVTFAALKPLRTIPSRVIALIGLNAPGFPRQNEPDGFNLMNTASRWRPGDPDKTAEDRGLFLESILAARDRLVVIVSGHSAEDNSERPLSPVVEELVATLAGDGAHEPHRLIVQQRPFPYSRDYFTQEGSNSGLFTHDAGAAAMAGPPEQPPRNEDTCLYSPNDFALPPFPAGPEVKSAKSPSSPIDEITRWDDWKLYWCEQAKYHIKRRLGIALDDIDAALPEDELPTDDAAGLDRHRLLQALMDLPATGHLSRQHAYATGLVSPSGLGGMDFSEAAEVVGELQNAIGQMGKLTLESVVFTATPAPGFALRFEGVYRLGRTADDRPLIVSVIVSTFREKHRAEYCLVSRMLGLHPQSLYYGGELCVLWHEKSKGRLRQERFPIPSCDDARQSLLPMVTDFLRHRDRPHPLTIEARLLLADSDDPPPPSKVLDSMFPRSSREPNAYHSALWSSGVEAHFRATWDQSTIDSLHAYERQVWGSVPGGRNAAVVSRWPDSPAASPQKVDTQPATKRPKAKR
jgi:exodeoxyribonuclease V gamma subunit